LLAARVVMGQGITVRGVCFEMQFASKDSGKFRKNVKMAAKSAGIPLRFVDISGKFRKMLKAPAHGSGANANPCVDCKILMLRTAKKIMEKENADFVVTGEVLGERPMSQRKEALNLIKKHSGIEDRLVRPLSAKLLKPTLPEKNGIIDRENLLDISGRSRERQLLLAKKYRIKRYFTPAGGCLLTEKVFGARIKDLIGTNKLTTWDIELLKYGRHFRLDGRTKAVLGRNRKENQIIKKMKKGKDKVLRMKTFPGPYALVRGRTTIKNLKKAGSIVAGFSKKKNEAAVSIEILDVDGGKKVVSVAPMGREMIEKEMTWLR